MLDDPGAVGQVVTFDEDQDESFNLITVRAALAYDIAPEMTAYVNAARGSKAGGYQFFSSSADNSVEQVAFDESSTWSFEAGVRGSAFGGDLRYSAAGFFTRTKDEQISDLDPLTFTPFTINLDAETYGAEFEATYAISENVAVRRQLGLLDTEVTADDEDLREGNELPFSPNVAAGLAIDVDLTARDVGLDMPGSVFGFANVQYFGEQFTDSFANAETDDYTLFDARIGWRQGNVAIYGYAENLFDGDYETNNLNADVNAAAGGPANIVIPGTPRIVGIGLRLTF
ncbi:MAG: TonB-dependent receptor [Pseudomonadota bacterium]